MIARASESGGIRTTCPYCGVGCGVQVDSDHAVSGDKLHPANKGNLCVKGEALGETLAAPDRLLYPEISGKRVDWSEALDEVASTFAAVVDEHGPDAVGMYLSGQLLTEDYYVANKLMKGFLGSSHVDTNSRLCMASAVAAHKRAFGEDVVPCSYDDIDACELLVIVGANTAWTHPVVYQRIRAARERGNLRIVVIDPRKTATTEFADLHLQIGAGDDLALFNALLGHLNIHGAIDHEFVRKQCSGFESTVAAAGGANFVSSRGDDATLAADVAQFFDWFTQTRRTLTLFSQGVNQSRRGTATGNAIINCHLATGRIGRPGMGPFSITGQPNAMGGREVGGMANQLAAHMDFDADGIATVERFWQAPRMATGPGKKAVEMFAALGSGEIKALWIMGTNPAVSLPASLEVDRALEGCDFLVVSDCVGTNATLKHADVRLPALGWGEKDGTVTNSERVISRQRSFLPAPGEARADWQIITDVAHRLGFEDAFPYTNPRDVFVEHAALTARNNNGARVLNLGWLAEVSTSEYNALEPVSWPLDARPFSSRTTPPYSTKDGRAQFVSTPLETALCTPNEEHLLINSGRYRDQWHTMTRTGTAERLFQHRREPRIDLNPVDAERYGVTDGDLLKLANANGDVCLSVAVTEDVVPGEAFVPIHWSNSNSSGGTVNRLYSGVTDPFSGQPESKYILASAKSVQPKHWGRLQLHTADTQLPWATSKAPMYWVRSLAGAGSSYVLASDSEQLAPSAELCADCEVVEFCDESNGVRRWLGRRDGKLIWRLWTAPSRDALPAPEALAENGECADWTELSLAGQGERDTSPVICVCYEVRRGAIEVAIEEGCSDEGDLGKQLKCGTNCGSCRPELRRLFAEAS